MPQTALTSSACRTTIRILESIRDKTSADPAAIANLSAFVRTVVDSSIAHGRPIASTRELGVRLNSKTADKAVALSLPRSLLGHYKRYAAAAGNHTLGALVCSALAAHYFSTPTQPSTVALKAPASAPQPATGWRGVLLALDLGQTREFARPDLPVGIERSRLNAHQTSQLLRETIPDFRITTRTTKSTLYVTRLA